MPADPEVPWDLVSIVRRSHSRSKIVELLGEEPLSATAIAQEIGLKRGSVSNYLRDLKTTDPPVVECITPDQPHHRLYDLTDTGEIVLKNL